MSAIPESTLRSLLRCLNGGVVYLYTRGSSRASALTMVAKVLGGLPYPGALWSVLGALPSLSDSLGLSKRTFGPQSVPAFLQASHFCLHSESHCRSTGKHLTQISYLALDCVKDSMGLSKLAMQSWEYAMVPKTRDALPVLAPWRTPQDWSPWRPPRLHHEF